MSDQTDVLQGTLDLLIMRTIALESPIHGWAIAQRIQQVSDDLLRVPPGLTSIPRSTASSIKAGSPLTGARRRTIAGRASTP